MEQSVPLRRSLWPSGTEAMPSGVAVDTGMEEDMASGDMVLVMAAAGPEAAAAAGAETTTLGTALEAYTLQVEAGGRSRCGTLPGPSGRHWWWPPTKNSRGKGGKSWA